MEQGKKKRKIKRGDKKTILLGKGIAHDSPLDCPTSQNQYKMSPPPIDSNLLEMQKCRPQKSGHMYDITIT